MGGRYGRYGRWHERVISDDDRRFLGLRIRLRRYRPTEKNYHKARMACMPIINEIVDVVKGRRGGIYHKIFLKILSDVRYFRPFEDYELIEYWDMLKKKMSDDEIRAILYLFTDKAIDSYVRNKQKHPTIRVDSFIMGNLLYQFKNYLRSHMSQEDRMTFVKDYDEYSSTYEIDDRQMFTMDEKWVVTNTVLYEIPNVLYASERYFMYTLFVLGYTAKDLMRDYGVSHFLLPAITKMRKEIKRRIKCHMT